MIGVGFIDFLTNFPYAKTCFIIDIIAVGAILFIIYIINLFVMYDGNSDDFKIDYENGYILKIIRYSEHLYLCLFDDCCRFLYDDVYISDDIINVTNVSSNKDSDNRVIFVECYKNNRKKTIKQLSIKCGKMSVDKFKHAKSVLMKY